MHTVYEFTQKLVHVTFRSEPRALIVKRCCFVVWGRHFGFPLVQVVINSAWSVLEITVFVEALSKASEDGRRDNSEC